MTENGDQEMGSQQGGVASAALSAVTALMEQRRRYEGWIAALDARRESTPMHVFERVHGDYSSRLHVVVRELSAHTDGLRAELEALEGRLHLIDQDQQRAADERAEGELRAHVGELSESDWTAAAAASDDRLAELAMSHAEVKQELARTRELLDEAERPAVTVADAAAPIAARAPADVELGSVHGPDGRVGEIAAEAAPPMELSASVIAAEQQILDQEAQAPVAEVQAEEPAGGDSASTAPGAPSAPLVPAGAPAYAPTPTPASSRFDELAFLSSVVDAPLGEVEKGPSDRPDEKARRNSFAQEQARDDGIVNLSDKRRTPLDHLKAMPDLEQEGEPPFASNVTGNYPIKLTENAAEGTKSLKCGECAALNYPTEWYCERCGAELASL